MKRWFNNAPDLLFSIIVSLYWVFHPKRESGYIYPSGNCWKVRKRDEAYFTFRHSLHRGSKSVQQHKYERYTHEDFCSVSSSDRVVDIGAFLGEFSIPAARDAKQVISIEPDPDTYNCLQQQIEDVDNILAVNELPAEKSKMIQFNTANDPTESSVFRPDNSDYQGIKLKSDRLDNIMDQLGENKIDFLKIDAEGAEPEVLRGIDQLTVRKIAIDTGEEREGEETTEEVMDILNRRDYETKIQEDKYDDPVTFARLEND